jgi:4'-phosphopantetheinyl transferase
MTSMIGVGSRAWGRSVRERQSVVDPVCGAEPTLIRGIPGDAHVWILPLQPEPTLLRELERLLCPAERARAHGFVFETHRRRYIAAHGLLRRILASYLGARPETLEFEAAEGAKPRLREPPTALDFNLSHSEDLGLVAVAHGREVGVDVEAVRPVDDLDLLAENCLSALEAIRLASIAETERPRAFLECWTRKEAFLKAVGDGLARPLDSFTVTVGSEEPVRLLSVEGDPSAPARWTLVPLRPAPGFVGTLAVETEMAAPRGMVRPRA